MRNIGFIRFFNKFIIFSPIKNPKRQKKSILRWIVKVGFDINKRFKIHHTRKRFCFRDKKATNDIVFPGFTIFGFRLQHCRFKKILSLLKKENCVINLTYRISITPSKKSIKKHFNKLSYSMFTLDINIHYRTLLKNINPIIWIWCNYFRYYDCYNRFRLSQYVTFYILKQWRKKLSRKKTFLKRFFKIRKQASSQSSSAVYLNFTTARATGTILLHTDFSPKTFVPISKSFSIFNGNNFYWNKRIATLENDNTFIKG
jgi:hypothetical protein